MNPGELFSLWDICDDAIVSSWGVLFRVGEIVGRNPVVMTGTQWEMVADGLYAGLKRLDDGISLQAIYCRGRLSDEETERLVGARVGVADTNDVLAYQRSMRAAYLCQRNLRDWRSYLVWGSNVGLTASEFKDLRGSHKKQLMKLEVVDRQVIGALQRANLEVRTLGNGEIVTLMQNLVAPGAVRRRPVVRREPMADDEALKREPHLRPQSVREQFIPGNMTWDEGAAKVDDLYFKVLTAQALPDVTTVGKFDLGDGGRVPLSELDFDFRITVHVMFPEQAAVQRSFRQRRKFAFSLAQRPGQVSDAHADVAEGEFGELANELAQGEKLVKIGIQAVLWAKSVPELEERAARMRAAFAKQDFDVFEESWAHHTELFKSLPGMSVGGFDRWKMTKSACMADLLPVATFTRGDREPVLVLEDAETRQPFGWQMCSKKRDNDNFQILGASGAGKSVFINMLLAYGVLSGPDKGKVLGIDYAGPTKSSFKVACEVFGGQYVGISGDGQKINPWPTPEKAISGGKLRPEVQSYLTVLTRLLLHQEGEGPEVALSVALIQKGIERLYERWSSTEAPLYSDYMHALAGIETGDVGDRGRLEDLIKLTRKVVDGPEGTLLNCKTTAATDGEFLVYDLYGLNHYEDRVKSAVAWVVTTVVRETAFDNRPDRRKYLFFEEAANLLTVGMKGAIHELLTTARAHGTSVGVVTQEYEAYRRSGVSGTVNLNTTTSVFLSHASAPGVIAPIAADFGFNEAEEKAFRELRAEKGKYSELLFRTTVDDPVNTSVGRAIVAKTRLYLSPFDLEVVRSDAAGRAAQQKIRQAYPNAPLVQVLNYLAYGAPGAGKKE